MSAFDLGPYPLPGPMHAAASPWAEPAQLASGGPLGVGGGSPKAMGDLFGGLFDGAAAIGVGAGPIRPVQPGQKPGEKPKDQPGQGGKQEEKPKEEPKKPPGWDGQDGFEEKQKKPGLPSLSPKAMNAIRDAGAIGLLGVILLALLDPEPATKLALAGLSAVLIAEILEGAGPPLDDPGVSPMI